MASSSSLFEEIRRKKLEKTSAETSNGKNGWENRCNPLPRQENGTAVIAGSSKEQPSHKAQRSTNMAAPCSDSLWTKLNTHVEALAKQGPILENLQANMKEMHERMTSLERKRTAEPEDNVVGKKRKTDAASSSSESGNESDEGDNLPENSNNQAISVDLDSFLSDGEINEEDSSEDELFKELKIFFADSEETGPDIDSNLSKILNHGLRSLAQTENVKKLKEKYKRPGNVGNLQVPRVAPVIWRNLTEKGKSVDAAVQKTVAKFLPGITPIIRQLDLLAQNKKEVKKNPILQEIKKLTSDAVQTLTHAVSASNQMRKDAIKSELDSKFHGLCEPSHPVSEKQLFGEKLSTELKELDDTKKFFLAKRSSGFQRDKRHTSFKPKYQEDFRKGYGKNHKPTTGFNFKKPYQSGQKKDLKNKWSQRRQ